jgi:hypothetical protein
MQSINCHAIDNISAIIAQYVAGELISIPASKEKFDLITYANRPSYSELSSGITIARRTEKGRYEIGYQNGEYEPFVDVAPKPLAVAYMRGTASIPRMLFWLQRNGHVRAYNFASDNFVLFPQHPRFDPTKKYGLKSESTGLGNQALLCFGNGHCYAWLVDEKGLLKSANFVGTTPQQIDSCLQSDTIVRENEEIHQIKIDGQYHLYKSYPNDLRELQRYPGDALFKAIKQGLENGLPSQPELDEDEVWV